MSTPRHPTQDARVFLFHCETYDVARIRKGVGAAMEELDLHPTGRTLVKPNLVCTGERGAACPVVSAPSSAEARPSRRTADEGSGAE